MFATTEHYQPFGSENVTIMVRRVATEPLPIPETHASELITGMWGLEALGETTLSASTGDNRPNLNLLPGGDANGFAGCNQFRTQYQVSTEGTEAKLNFSPVAASRKMCEQTMALEGAMLAALNATQKYRLSESTLTLMDGDGKEVARFLRLNE
jgi:heat shock protein HslJ